MYMEVIMAGRYWTSRDTQCYRAVTKQPAFCHSVLKQNLKISSLMSEDKFVLVLN
jgi:hypothetical protein